MLKTDYYFRGNYKLSVYVLLLSLFVLINVFKHLRGKKFYITSLVKTY